MGFRDLKSFNKALLAKQGWRLQTNNHSLFSRVFKAKYFLGCEFKDATLGKHPLFAWRSIMSTQAVVEKGRRWTVGNGKSIHIWSDNWLPSISHPRVLSLVQASRAIAKVSDLIADGSREWNSIVVRQVFCAEEANSILSIPLSIRLPVDRVV